MSDVRAAIRAAARVWWRADEGDPDANEAFDQAIDDALAVERAEGAVEEVLAQDCPMRDGHKCPDIDHPNTGPSMLCATCDQRWHRLHRVLIPQRTEKRAALAQRLEE